MKPIIEIQNIGKKYKIGAPSRIPELTRTIDVKGQKSAKAAYQGENSSSDGRKDEFWALRDVSFSVNEGETIGIIGRNGAGKSTLLKILSKITPPTTGKIFLRGRVASLLEVGTGFHPELTGRENIYLNGAILGMTRAEIKNKFDEIVAFSEIEKFLDTPVKRYSSGMYVRLAFAVAAHLEPEILVVDEVLAVGDGAFQQKCLGKMGNISQEGRTVLFVSHNMAAVRSLCEKAIWLERGRVKQIGNAEEVISTYIQQDALAETRDDISSLISRLPRDPAIQLLDIRINQSGRNTLKILNTEPVSIDIEYEVFQTSNGLRVYFDLCDEYGDILIRSFHDEHQDEICPISPGYYKSCATIPPYLLAPRNYILIVRATIHNVRIRTGRGVYLSLGVSENRRINLRYPDQPVLSKMRPTISWLTKASNK